MEKSKEPKIILAAATIITTMILLFAATITIAPQQAYSLSRYVIGDNNPNHATDDVDGKIYQPLEQEPSIPTVGCAMDTIESLESFLSCLGAK